MCQDLVLTFFTARFDEENGVWMFHLPAIARHYLKTWFFIDVVSASTPCLCVHMTEPVCVDVCVLLQLSCIPFDLVGILMSSPHTRNARALRLLRLLRLFRLIRLLKSVE